MRDQHYQDAAGRVHYLSAADHIAAAGAGLPLPGADWTPITADAALAILNPGPSSDEIWAALRTERDKRLIAATAILDRHRNQRDFGLTTTLTDAEATAWATYAQSLRDLPEATSDPAAPKWPVEPGQAPTAA